MKRRLERSTRASETVRMIRDLEAGEQDSERYCEKSEFFGFSPRKITFSAKIPEPQVGLSCGVDHSTRAAVAVRMSRSVNYMGPRLRAQL